MRSQFNRRIMLFLVVLLTVGLGFGQAEAQRRRTKRSRRVTNPVIVPARQPTLPTTQADPQIISTADQQAADQGTTSEISGQSPATTGARRTNRKQRPAEPDDEDSMRRTVNDLSTQVTKLSDKLSQMEQQQRTLVDLERLSRAEQRAELLRTQLRDVEQKEADLTARMEQIEFDIKPENIERSVATYGSTHPEDARDARRRALESEQTRVRSQLNLLTTSRQRLETAIASADMEVDKLRKRIEEAEPQAKTDNATDADDTSTTAPATTNPPAPNTANPPREKR